MKVIEVVENVNKQNKQKNVYMLESVDCVVYLFSTILNNFWTSSNKGRQRSLKL